MPGHKGEPMSPQLKTHNASMGPDVLRSGIATDGWGHEVKNITAPQSAIQAQVKNETKSTRMKRWIIYHANCRDGQFAAWAALPADPHYELVPFRYGQKLDFEKFRNDQVIYLDCAPTVEEYHQLKNIACLITVLDHHKSSLSLADLPGCHIDMERSGARQAWEYFHDQHPPTLIRYVEDHDLWRWELPESREVNAWISTLPADPEVLEEYMDRPLGEIIEIGRIVLDHQQRQVDKLIKHAFEVEFLGYSVLAVNCPVKDLISFCGERLAVNRPFSIVFSPTDNDEAICSLRSDSGGIDVANLAKRLGGGGHRRAAGCRVPLSWLIAERAGQSSSRLRTTISQLIRRLSSEDDGVRVFAQSLLEKIYQS